MKTFVEIHVLQNFAPSNLNRDDTGAPKDAFFGGTRRARISSQCIKNAARKYFASEKILSEDEMAIRTKRLLGELTKELCSNKGRNEKEAKEKIIIAINSLGFKFKDNVKTQYLIFLGKNEILRLATLIDEKWDEIGSPEGRLSSLKKELTEQLFPDSIDNEKFNSILNALDIAGDVEKLSDTKITAVENCISEIIKVLKEKINSIKPEVNADGKNKKKKKDELTEWEKEIAEILKDGKKGLSPLGKALQTIFDGGKAVDIALFGRMLADMPEKNQYASCQVAHAISTNSINREFDFYTAIDELKPEDNSGSDMMGDIEFTSACFYRYAIVDYQKLCENLQSDEILSQKGLKAFLSAFVIAEPTGKQNSFAAHNAPELIAINVCHNGAPRNLSNAFEVPVKVKNSESLTKQSASKLSAKANALNSLLGTENVSSRYVCAADTFKDVDKLELNGLGERENSVPELIEWVISQLDKKGK